MAFSLLPAAITTVAATGGQGGGMLSTLSTIASVVSKIPMIGGLFDGGRKRNWKTQEGRMGRHLVESWPSFLAAGLTVLPAGYIPGFWNWGACVDQNTPIPIEIIEEAIRLAWPCAIAAGPHIEGTEAGTRCIIDHMQIVMAGGNKNEIIAEGYRRLNMPTPPCGGSISPDGNPDDTITAQMGKTVGGIFEDVGGVFEEIPMWTWGIAAIAVAIIALR